MPEQEAEYHVRRWTGVAKLDTALAACRVLAGGGRFDRSQRADLRGQQTQLHLPSELGLRDLAEQSEAPPEVFDGLDVGGSSRGAHRGVQPRADRILKPPRCGQVVSNYLREYRSLVRAALQQVDDPAVYQTAL